MAIDGRDKILWEKRREATRETLMQAPKSGGAVGLNLLKLATKVAPLGYKTEGPMLKAQCKRLAGRAHVINNTVFRFDENGICRLIDQGYDGAAFELLCKQNGVVRLDPETELPMGQQPAAAPAVVEEPKKAKKAEVVVEAAVEAPKTVDENWEAGPPDLVVPAPAAEEAAVEDTKKARRKPAKE